jgi:exosortase J
MSVTADRLCNTGASPRLQRLAVSGQLLALAAAALVLLCSVVLLPWWISIHRLWSHDPLRSIGMWFPLVSLVGVVRAWRRLGWTLEGTWWGLVPIAVSVPIAHMVTTRLPYLYIYGHELGVAKLCLPIFPCALGAVLLFGGNRLLRACWAPLLVLLLLDPVPHVYNQWLDLPLQHLSANTARAFAHLIGLQPTGQQLQMMFTPSFGMMIVPGCDGIRGSITLAYLALIFGYSRNLRVRTLAGVVVGALSLGFAMNLVRLCVLVLYYRAGMAFPSWQPYGTQVDYVIGCTVFLTGTVALGLFLRSLRPGTIELTIAPVAPTRAQIRSTVLRMAALITLTLLYFASEVRTLPNALAQTRSDDAVFDMFPKTVGSYKLVGQHAESLGKKNLAFAFGDYEATEADGSIDRITLGLWVASRYHQIANSRAAQGYTPVWSGAINASADIPVHFMGSVFTMGPVQEYDADAICSTEMCSGSPLAYEFTLGHDTADHLRFAVDQSNRLPIVLQATWPSTDAAHTAELRARFEDHARVFTSHLKLKPLVQQIGSQR